MPRPMVAAPRKAEMHLDQRPDEAEEAWYYALGVSRPLLDERAARRPWASRR